MSEEKNNKDNSTSSTYKSRFEPYNKMKESMKHAAESQRTLYHDINSSDVYIKRQPFYERYGFESEFFPESNENVSDIKPKMIQWCTLRVLYGTAKYDRFTHFLSHTSKCSDDGDNDSDDSEHSHSDDQEDS